MATNSLFADNGAIKKISTADWNSLQGSSVAGVDSIGNVTGDNTIVFDGTGAGPYTDVVTAKVNPVLSLESLTLTANTGPLKLGNFEIANPNGNPNGSVLTIDTGENTCIWSLLGTQQTVSGTVQFCGYNPNGTAGDPPVKQQLTPFGVPVRVARCGDIISICVQFPSTGINMINGGAAPSSAVNFIGSDLTAGGGNVTFASLLSAVGYAGSTTPLYIGTCSATDEPHDDPAAGAQATLCNVVLNGTQLYIQATNTTDSLPFQLPNSFAANNTTIRWFFGTYVESMFHPANALGTSFLNFTFVNLN